VFVPEGGEDELAGMEVVSALEPVAVVEALVDAIEDEDELVEVVELELELVDVKFTGT